MQGWRRTLTRAIPLGAIGVVVFVIVEETLCQLLTGVLGAGSGAGAVAAGVIVALALRPFLAHGDRLFRRPDEVASKRIGNRSKSRHSD